MAVWHEEWPFIEDANSKAGTLQDGAFIADPELEGLRVFTGEVNLQPGRGRAAF
ncbi:hypothetical protein RISK_002795 [Rhodopirellula islandica]|uniref:Uncharacterized protein n=1 Tax=Rhodopirellula islandica TaxID=595434 RepID=A0A0J1BEM0_RHOIS|nr:hypothetical protein RISK_002795 [Rhodopirellula islandica]